MKNTNYAGFLRRFAAFCLDHLIFGALIGIIAFVLVFPALLLGFLSMFSMVTITLFTVTLWLGGTALFVGIHWAYFAGFEASYLQATPGKLAMGIYVCDGDNQKITLKRSTFRYLGRFLSTAFFYLGYAISLFTEKRQTLHDLLSQSLVVRGYASTKKLEASTETALVVPTERIELSPMTT